ncbi:MAG: hypothetical protein HC897_08835, partial [Thermoanaerobaculia bacterium]|nr:hypothetical protein [Thermoanaerobaculia bacterium]
AASRRARRAVGDGRFKLVEFPRLEGGYRRELYDLENDPAERHDVARENREVALRLAAALDAWTAEQPAPAGIELSEEELETLRALGYVN